MEYLWIALAVAAGIVLLVLLIAYICYRVAFYSAPRKPLAEGEIPLPDGEIYEPYHDSMRKWVVKVRSLPCEEMEITSFDGLKLRGRYYEYAPGAPIELMMHGYRGDSERDMSAGVLRAFKLGRSALIVDQRCCGRSEGSTITFGINEHRDCLDWLALMQKRFGSQAKIILTGISMGASTVIMAAGKGLPDNVIGVLADCGYTSPEEIIKVVIRKMRLPADLSYPFVKLGARLFGHFNLDEYSPIEAAKRSKVPIIFIHGESDDFVPCEMSRVNYEACVSRKMLVTIPGAGHGLAYPVEPETYLGALREFFGEDASAPKRADA